MTGSKVQIPDKQKGGNASLVQAVFSFIIIVIAFLIIIILSGSYYYFL